MFKGCAGAPLQNVGRGRIQSAGDLRLFELIGISDRIQGLAVFERRECGIVLKHPFKISQTLIPQQVRNLGDAHIRLLQIPFGFADAVNIGIFTDRISCYLLKNPADVGFAQVKMSAEFI